MTDDLELLKASLAKKSEESAQAFATLAARHMDLVYSVALRYVNNPPQAKEITQAVFIILARRGRKLEPGTILSSWLFYIARLTSARFLKTEVGRVHRELEVHILSLNRPAEDPTWKGIALLLDEAIASLEEKERNLIVLHLIQGKNFAEVAAALRMDENTALLEVDGAIDKLTSYFNQHGLPVARDVLTAMIPRYAVQSAPPELAPLLSASAAVKAAPALKLARGTMNEITWKKAKVPVTIGASVFLLLLVAAVSIASYEVYLREKNRKKPPSPDLLRNIQGKYASLTSYRDSGKIVSEVGGKVAINTFSMVLARPNLYRIEWEQMNLDGEIVPGAVWSASMGHYLIVGNRYERLRGQVIALAAGSLVSSGAAAAVPGTFFDLHWGNAFNPLKQKQDRLMQEKDEKVGKIDCHVLSSTITKEGITGVRTIWIGKKDFLIHQTRQAFTGEASWPSPTDDAIKRRLEKENKPAGPDDILAWRAAWEKKMSEASKQLKQSIIYLETHENIRLNEPTTLRDFDYPVPEGMILNEPPR